MTDPARAAALALLTPDAVRERSGRLLAAAEAGAGPFEISAAGLERSADLVVKEIEARHPDLCVPVHGRLRHFVVAGADRLQASLQESASSPEDAVRICFDLVITSVLLDAGAGPDWRFVDPSSGTTFARSEGLALASLAAFRRGLFSAAPDQPLRADGEALAALTPARLAEAFQVRRDNPLVGLEPRAGLLNRLGAVIAADPARFGRPARLGHLFDHLVRLADGDRLPARSLLSELLLGFGPVWPGRLELAGLPLGDTWFHPAALQDSADPADGLIPFHKLSQWLAYSLVEPLQLAGIDVTGLDQLTALAEYRNGGLLIDAGALGPRDPAVLDVVHPVDGEVVVAWRALTVGLIDRLAELVRARLGVSPEAMPLARVLEGGTWHAGRRLARERRSDGSPPLCVRSDGTVF